MELSLRMRDMIEKKLTACEKKYDIKILLWSLRGSLDIGIYRRNSDLDLIFIFQNLSHKKVAAIHDIVGYGFDFWGWNIEDVIKTIDINNNLYYKEGKNSKNISLTKEHERGGLTYYFGIYCCLGNKKSGSNVIEISKLKDKLLDIMEKYVLISHIISDVKGKIAKLEIEEGMSACDYLYTVWRLLLAEHVYHGEMPGESEMDFLMSRYMKNETIKIINRLRSIYRNSISKHSQFFQIKDINEFIYSKYIYLEKDCENLKPEHESSIEFQIDGIKKCVDELKIGK